MKAWLPLEVFYVVTGLFLLAVAVRSARARPRRWGPAAFWGLLAVAVGAGRWLPPAVVGGLIVVLALLATRRPEAVASIQKSDTEARAAARRRLGGRLLRPLLLVPALAILGGWGLPAMGWAGRPLVEAGQAAQVALALGCLAGVSYALRLTRARPVVAVAEGGRLLQLLGWTLLLPPALAALGGIFARVGVGEEVARLVAAVLPVERPLVAVVAYAAGMTLFTVLMGNAFAAFPVLTLGVGLPFIVRQHGGDPAIMGVFGLLSGYCGTLVTPMAANFNLVPVRLLELRDDYAVIRAQAPWAAAIWIFNVAMMALCVYRC